MSVNHRLLVLLLLPSLWVSLSGLLSCQEPQPSKQVDKQIEKPVEKSTGQTSKKCVNSICPVTDLPVNESFSVVCMGSRVGFANAEAKKKFSMDPGPYMEKLEEQANENRGNIDRENKDEVGEIIIPPGADAADIATIRGANEMLRAEARLRKQLKAGKVKGIDKLLVFEEISSWPYEEALQGLPKKLKKLDKTKVMMIGFMLPIDEVENIREFLLVQSLWSCCYGQPPDINGTVRVVMKGKKRLDYQYEPVMVTGEFRIEATLEEGFCVDIYQIYADQVKVIK